MIIPLFMIKEDSSKHLQPGEKEVGMVKSIACTFKNRRFIQWMIAFCFMQFGLQLFIAGQNVYYSGVLKFTGVNIFLMTVFAFGPVPLTLILYNKIVNKKGFKFGFIYSLICFIIAMVLLAICNEKIISNLTIRLIISCIGGLCCSFGLGTFFSVGYIIPSSLAESERKATGVNNSAMYFAVQGLFSGVSAALATGIIWVNLKRFNLTWTMTIVSALAMMICLVITLFLPKSLNNIGKID
jgi:Na+/melibiose symporter-like transporter